MTESKPPGGGVVAMIMSVVTILMQIWGSIPEESRKKLITTIVEGFDGVLRRFFRRFHQLEAQPGQEVAP